VAVSNVSDSSFWRFTEHALPAFVLLLAFVPLLVPRGRGRSRLPGATGQPLRRRTAAVALIVLGLVPLAVVAGAGRAAAGSTVRLESEKLSAPTQDLHVRVHRLGRHLDIRWDRPATDGRAVVYRIYQSPAPCSVYGAPVRYCIITFQPVAQTTQRHIVVPHVAGSRWIRVAVGADHAGGTENPEVFLVTPPVEIPR
jgi:hypothetical protein